MGEANSLVFNRDSEPQSIVIKELGPASSNYKGPITVPGLDGGLSITVADGQLSATFGTTTFQGMARYPLGRPFLVRAMGDDVTVREAFARESGDELNMKMKDLHPMFLRMSHGEKYDSDHFLYYEPPLGSDLAINSRFH